MEKAYVFEAQDLTGLVSVKLKKNQFAENSNFYHSCPIN